MLHGKKGFDRVLHAFKNVLTAPVTWLFSDLGAETHSPDPMMEHFPIVVKCIPKQVHIPRAIIPSLQPPLESREEYRDDLNDFSVDIYEWLALLSLDSPRLDLDDHTDPFLSRYAPPTAVGPDHLVKKVVKITWEGFLSPSWAHVSFLQAVLAATPTTWFSFAVCGFNDSLGTESRDCTILKLPGASKEYMLWEVGRS